ncbi:MAG: CocE/NonD family hydrolase [Anaerolineae bacterium]
MYRTRQWGPDIATSTPALIDQAVELLWGVKIPMRDGVKLNATVFRPKNSNPLPVIFTLTPYLADTYQIRAAYFSRNGYVFAMVDCRGRGNSEGEFLPFFNEGRDGYDLVEWFAAQPWCDGQVTMWGGSYGGFDQWMTLREQPPHLKTVVPVASAHMGVDFPMFGNIANPYLLRWMTYTSGVTPNMNLFGDTAFWTEKYRELYRTHAPFRSFDQIAGNLSTSWQLFVDHPVIDEFWNPLALKPEEYDRITLKILTITGHYDGDQPGAFAYYKRHMASQSPARDDHYLIVGPWDHAGTRTPNRNVGGLDFGEACLIDMHKLHKDWYDWTLKGGSKPEFLKKRVVYYVVGSNEWKYADSLETIASETRSLYLDSHGRADDVFHSGILSPENPSGSASDSWIYDPLDTRPGDAEKDDGDANYLIDQTSDLNRFGGGVVYHSAPFTEATEITGFIKLTAWIAIDVPDTDFMVTLAEVLPDGRYVRLTDDMKRARYRDSLKAEKLVTPGEIVCYEFDSFFFFSRLVGKGSRLRLSISSPNTIQMQKNYNSGGVVADETAADARTAHITLYHDADHPSRLELPIVSTSSGTGAATKAAIITPEM